MARGETMRALSPFSSTQLMRLDEALNVADGRTGLTFSIYVGPFGELESEADPGTEVSRARCAELHAQLADPARSVLVAVSPNERVVEVVTGASVKHRVPDRMVELAVLSMTAAFGGGDLSGGIVTGVRMLADAAVAG